MRLLDLFSGIGGFSLAAQWVWGDDLEIVAFCEIDKYCQKVLHRHWPEVPIIEDIRDVTYSNGNGLQKSGSEQQASRYRQFLQSGQIDLLTGGFPCQPFSVAGKRKGKEDNRFLWPEMFAVIKEIRPCWVVAENVAGIIRMALDDCLSDLEGEGYSTQTVIIPACAVNAPHRRDRVWIVAHSERSCGRGGFSKRMSNSDGKTTRTEPESLQSRNKETYSGDSESGSQDVADISKQRLEGEESTGKLSGREQGLLTQCDWWSVEPDVGRVAHGVSNRVDRLKSLGNAIVPQVAEQIFRAIKEIEE